MLTTLTTTTPAAPPPVRGLSTKQPWANLIGSGLKTLEIRTWATRYRGELLILASQKRDKLDWLHPAWPVHQTAAVPLGVAICLVTLTDCRPMTKADERAAQCPYEPGLFAWCLENARFVPPWPVKGGLSLLHLPEELQERLRKK